MNIKVVPDLRTGRTTDVKPIRGFYYEPATLNGIHRYSEGMYMWSRHSDGHIKARSPTYSFKVDKQF